MRRMALAGAAVLCLAACAKNTGAVADKDYMDGVKSFAVPINPISQGSKIVFLYDADRIGGAPVKLIMAHSEAATLKVNTVFVLQSPPQLLRSVLSDADADGVVFDPVDGHYPRVLLKTKIPALLGQVAVAPDLPFAVEIMTPRP